MSETETDDAKEVYIVKTEPHAVEQEISMPIFDVYEDYEEAKEHNSEGGWSDHTLYPAPFHHE